MIVNSLFFAGIDTQLTTLEWFNIYILHHPECQQKMYEEVKDKIGKMNLLDYFYSLFDRFLSIRWYCIWVSGNALWYWKGDKAKLRMIVVNLTNRWSFFGVPTKPKYILFFISAISSIVICYHHVFMHLNPSKYTTSKRWRTLELKEVYTFLLSC